MKKIKTFVLTVSDKFPSCHKNSGHETGFIGKINEGTKIHTIRKNYDFWKKRADTINAGEGILSLRYWSGLPYKSKQVEFKRLEGIGVQRLKMNDSFSSFYVDDCNIACNVLAVNDGLDVEDFYDWFKEYDLSDLVIINFTDFVYK